MLSWINPTIIKERRFASRRRRGNGDCSRGLCSRLCTLTRTRLRLAWQSLWMLEQGLRVIRTMWGRRSWGTVTRPPSGSVRPVMTETLWQPLSPRPCHDALYLHPTPSAAVSTFVKKVILINFVLQENSCFFLKNTIKGFNALLNTLEQRSEAQETVCPILKIC